ncbi:hypothetical protein [Embleya sp. NPDC059237]|uniref:hypothetical protein n=1 Tax=Embleya sp. NPDC059237 TaxID=3346784 RepID=UPI0036ACBF30
MVGRAAEVFTDPTGYLASVQGAPPAPPATATAPGWTGEGLLPGAVSTVLAVGGAAAAVWGPRLHGRSADRARTGLRRLDRAAAPLRRLHSGHVGDYVACLVTGMAVLGPRVHPWTAGG